MLATTADARVQKRVRFPHTEARSIAISVAESLLSPDESVGKFRVPATFVTCLYSKVSTVGIPPPPPPPSVVRRTNYGRPLRKHFLPPPPPPPHTPISVRANRRCNYAFQLMKQSPPRPCYLVVSASHQTAQEKGNETDRETERQRERERERERELEC